MAIVIAKGTGNYKNCGGRFFIKRGQGSDLSEGKIRFDAKSQYLCARDLSLLVEIGPRFDAKGYRRILAKKVQTRIAGISSQKFGPQRIQVPKIRKVTNFQARFYCGGAGETTMMRLVRSSSFGGSSFLLRLSLFKSSLVRTKSTRIRALA